MWGAIMTKIMLVREDNSVSIATLTGDVDDHDAHAQLLIDNHNNDSDLVSKYGRLVRYVVMDNMAEPDDGTFFNAWVANDNNLSIDMNKARLCHLNKLRQLRSDKFIPLDIAFTKAIERNDTATMASIAAQKQILRDIPERLDLSQITDPTILKNTIPDELK